MESKVSGVTRHMKRRTDPIVQEACLPSFFERTDFLRNACDGPRGRVPHKQLSTCGRPALRSGHGLALQEFGLGHVGEDWTLLPVPAGGGSGRERCVCAIGRLLDDAARSEGF